MAHPKLEEMKGESVDAKYSHREFIILHCLCMMGGCQSEPSPPRWSMVEGSILTRPEPDYDAALWLSERALLMATGDGWLRSDDQGDSWRSITVRREDGVVANAVQFIDGDRALILGGMDVIRTHHLEAIDTGLQRDVLRLAVGTDKRSWLLDIEGRAGWSLDGGVTWQHCDTGAAWIDSVRDVTMLEDGSVVALLAPDSSGRSIVLWEWQECTARTLSAPTVDGVADHFGAASRETMWVHAIDQGGYYLTITGGAKWRFVPDPLGGGLPIIAKFEPDGQWGWAITNVGRLVRWSAESSLWADGSYSDAPRGWNPARLLAIMGPPSEAVPAR